jgi:hypothetical protein
MFSLEIFAEILIVGLLLIFATIPILIRFNPALQEGGLFSILDVVGNKGAAAALALIFAYVVGIAGNRLVDDAFESVYESPGGYKQLYKQWAVNTNNPIVDMRVAEFELRERSEATWKWLDRRRSYVRILRGAIASFLILLVSMAIYEFSRPAKRRYQAHHFIAALLLLSLFIFAYIRSDIKYHKRVYELATELPAKQSGITVKER